MFDKLFESMKIGKLEIKNRLVVPPMHSGSATKEHLFGDARKASDAKMAIYEATKVAMEI